MGWRDGCVPRPAGGGSVIVFDFGAADALGVRLAVLRAALVDLAASRTEARRHLVDWSGRHRREHDEQAAAMERALAAGIDRVAHDLARLRAAWDLAATLQAGAVPGG